MHKLPAVWNVLVLLSTGVATHNPSNYRPISTSHSTPQRGCAEQLQTLFICDVVVCLMRGRNQPITHIIILCFTSTEMQKYY